MNPLLFPVIAAQGLWVRYRTEVLPPAGGASSGSVTELGAGNPVRLAVVGESTAAGCGADTHDEAFPGALARELATRTGRPVSWDVVGQYGATSRRIRHRLLPQLGENYDLAVLLAGANDVLGRRRPSDWADDLAAVVDDLAARAEQVVVVGLPPFAAFPSLPWPLSDYLAGEAAGLDAVAAQVCADHSRTTWVSSTGVLRIDPNFFARDGFHLSSCGYGQWAEVVAQKLPARPTTRTSRTGERRSGRHRSG